MRHAALRAGIVAAAALTILVSCLRGASDPGRPLGIFFPRHSGSGQFPTALLRGELRLEEGCLWIHTERIRYLAVWPRDAVPRRRADGTILVEGREGKLFAEQGGTLSVAGGEIIGLRQFADVAGEEPPSGCRSGSFWYVAEIARGR